MTDSSQPAGNGSITCKKCGHTEALSKKFKCSRCGAANWGYELPKKKNNGCLFEIIAGILLIAGVAAYNSYKEYREKHWSKERIENAFVNNVVVVHHEYVYELEFDDPNEEPLYFVKKETGEFEQWQKGLQPNTVSGCGLLENSQGKCLTSKKICRPHIDDWDVIGLKRQVQVFRGPPFNIRSGGHYKIFTITLGYYLPGRKMNEPGSFISSNVSGSYSEGVDELSPKSALDTLGGITELYTTPDYSDMKHGDPVFVISYALPLSNIDPLHPLMAAGSIDAVRQPSLGTYEFSYQIPVMVPIEGSPVFSESGKVLGFTSMDSSGVNRAVSFGLNPVKK